MNNNKDVIFEVVLQTDGESEPVIDDNNDGEEENSLTITNFIIPESAESSMTQSLTEEGKIIVYISYLKEMLKFSMHDK